MVLPAGMVVMIGASVPGPLRRLTLAVAEADRESARGTGATCGAGPGKGAGAEGGASCPATGGLCCAGAEEAIVPTTAIQIAGTTLEFENMANFPR